MFQQDPYETIHADTTYYNFHFILILMSCYGVITKSFRHLSFFLFRQLEKSDILILFF